MCSIPIHSFRVFILVVCAKIIRRFECCHLFVCSVWALPSIFCVQDTNRMKAKWRKISSSTAQHRNTTACRDRECESERKESKILSPILIYSAISPTESQHKYNRTLWQAKQTLGKVGTHILHPRALNAKQHWVPVHKIQNILL